MDAKRGADYPKWKAPWLQAIATTREATQSQPANCKSSFFCGGVPRALTRVAITMRCFALRSASKGAIVLSMFYGSNPARPFLCQSSVKSATHL